MAETTADWGRLNQISERVLGFAYAVSNGLGSGFLKKVYENALAHELRKVGLSVAQQHAMVARYDGVVVVEYVADLLVESLVLVELKHARALDDVHLAQCLNVSKRRGYAFSFCSSSAGPASRFGEFRSEPERPHLHLFISLSLHLCLSVFICGYFFSGLSAALR